MNLFLQRLRNYTRLREERSEVAIYAVFIKLYGLLRRKLLAMTVVLMLMPCSALAAQTGANSWEQVLTQIVSSLTGPVAYCISIMAVFVSGLTIAFADLQGGAKKFVQVALGLSVALFASQIITGFFHFSGAII